MARFYKKVIGYEQYFRNFLFGKKIRFRKAISILLLVFYLILILNWIYNKYQVATATFGVQANPLRLRLHIPVIEKEMDAVEGYNKWGNRWEGPSEFPESGHILHCSKIVNLSVNGNIDNEIDSFRRKINDTVYQQLNIDSKINNDSGSIREGSIFYGQLKKSILGSSRTLNESGIDSIARAWKLNYLIRH